MNKHMLYKEDLDRVLRNDINLEKIQGKRILIVGATGMIGACLVDLLMAYSVQMKHPFSVVALSRNEEKMQERFENYLNNKNFFYIIGDINLGMPMIKGHIDFIIYAASNSHPEAYVKDPIGTIRTNVIGLDYLLDYGVKEEIQRFIFLSSIEIYGENTIRKERFSELDCGYINCNTLRAGYPESKRVGEALCQAYRKKYGLDVVIARLSRVYGPTMQMNDSKVISQFICRAAHKQDIILKSDGSTKYSYIYVVDVVTAILTILLKGKAGEAYNVADSCSEISILKLANMIAEMAGTTLIFEEPDEEEKAGYSNVHKSLMSERKLKKLGWKPCTILKEGVDRTIKYMEDKEKNASSFFSKKSIKTGYENCISLGCFCGVASSMGYHGLRSHSGPFDWLFSEFESVLKMIETNFSDFLVKDNLRVDSKNKQVFHDIKYGFDFLHDVESDFEAEYPLIYQKYVRRVQRFMQDIKESTCFIRAVRTEQELSFIEKNREYIYETIRKSNAENEIVFLLLKGMKKLPDDFLWFRLNIEEYIGEFYDMRNMFNTSLIFLEYCEKYIFHNQKISKNKIFDEERLREGHKVNIIMAEMAKKSQNIMYVIKRHYRYIERGIFLWGAGDCGKAVAEYLLAMKIRVNGIIDNNQHKAGTLYKDIPIIFAPEIAQDDKNIFIAVKSYNISNKIERQILEKYPHATVLKLVDLYKGLMNINETNS